MKREELKKWILENLFDKKGRINSNRVKYSYFQKTRLISYYEQITQQTSFLNKNSEDISISERLYYIMNDIFSVIKCKHCDKKPKFKCFSKGYFDFCSKKCSDASKHTKEKRKKTSIEKYGTEYPQQNTTIKKSICNGVQKSTGYEYPLQSPKSKEKLKETNNKKWGSDFVGGSANIKEKIKQTSQEKYGVDHPFQSEESRKQARNIMEEKYGVESPLQLESIREQCKQTNLQKYSVEYYTQTKEFTKKKKETWFNNHGVENPFQSDIIKEKIKQTNLEKYGVEFVSQRNNINLQDLNKKFIIKNFLDENNHIKIGDFQKHFNCCYSNVYKIIKKLGVGIYM